MAADRPQESAPTPRTPWEELVVQEDRGPGGRRSGSAQRDRAVRDAIRSGSSTRRLAELLGVSVQAVYQAAERAEAEESVDAGPRYAEILSKLQELTDAPRFEELASILLARFIPDLRPTQRSGDRGRDAVAGDGDLLLGEELVVTVSLAADWSRKVSSDMGRIAEQGLGPRRVYAVTSRKLDERRLLKLQREAAAFGWGLTVFDGRWLATQLAQPEGAKLCRDYLGLAAPRPSVFLDAEEFGRLLAAAAPTAQVDFVGRGEETSRLRACLEQGRTIILEAAGGMGKSRLLSELALGDDSRRWLFLRKAIPFSEAALSEAGTGDVVVVIDDSHRREDRGSVLAMLERRTPTPLLVMVCRPGFKEAIEADLEGLAFGPVERVTVGPLPRPELAKLLEEPPLEVRYGALRTAIVELSEGNPQIASIAAELSRRGLAVHELRGGEVMRAYAGAVLRQAGEGGRDRLALMAVVAAVGELDLTGEDAERAADLLGLPRPHLRRDVADLADRGLISEQGGLVSIKPDVLAEHILVGCFFDREWDPALDYCEVYRGFSPRHGMEMLSVLGQAFNAAPESAETAPNLLACVRRDLIGAGEKDWGTEQIAEASAAVAPGLPTMALEAFDQLLSRLDADLAGRPGLWPMLLKTPSRVPLFAEGWRRMLTLAQRLFAIHAFEDPFAESNPSMGDGWGRSLKTFDEAFKGVHQRLPIEQSAADGRMLAAVQEAMAHLTPLWWQGARQAPGAPEAALLAARTMLKVTYGANLPDAANPRQINMLSLGVPASGSTKRSLDAGFGLLSEAMPMLSLKGQLRALEVLRSLAHPGLGFAGAFGLELSDATKDMINELFDASVVPWLAAELNSLPLPVGTAALEMLEWRAHFGKPPSVHLEPAEDLRDYRELIEPGEDWDAEEPRRAGRAREGKVAERRAIRLAAAPDLRGRLAELTGWYELRLLAAPDRPPHGVTLGMLFEQVVRSDLTRGMELVDLLLETGSPLVAHAAPAIAVALNGDPAKLDSWLDSDSEGGRTALAWAAGEVRDESLQRRLMSFLAADPEPAVREATARALRYRTALSGWQLDLALELSLEQGRLWLLADLLEELAESGDAGSLSPARRQAIEAALLASAEDPGTRGDEQAAEVLEAAAEFGLDLVWAWIWRRLDRLAVGGPAPDLSEGLPEPIIGLAAARSEPSAPARIAARLDQTSPSDWRLEEPLIRLAIIGDDGTLASHLVSWVRGGPADQRRLYRLLNSPMSWERFETYAAAVLSADPSPENIGMVVAAREPTSFIGSRVPRYEEIRDRFLKWMTSDDANLVRVADFARAHFDKRIAEARVEEQQLLEGYGG